MVKIARFPPLCGGGDPPIDDSDMDESMTIRFSIARCGENELKVNYSKVFGRYFAHVRPSNHAI